MYFLAVVGHLLAVVILVGSTAMMALVVLPATSRGRLSPAALRSIGRGFSLLTAVSGIVVFLTGIYATSVQYTARTLVSTTSGWLVLASIGVWVILALVLTVGTGRLARAVAVDDVRKAARDSRRWYNAAVLVALFGVAISAPL